MLSTIAIEPADLRVIGVRVNVLHREQKLPRRAERLAQTEQILRSRLNFQGTVMTFSTASRDVLWWLMVSEDAARLLLSLLEFTSWNDDRLGARRAVQDEGRALGFDNCERVGVAMDKFSKMYEKTPVAGRAGQPWTPPPKLWIGRN